MGESRDQRATIDKMIQDAGEGNGLGMGNRTDRDRERRENLGASLIDDSKAGIASIDARLALLQHDKTNRIEMAKLDVAADQKFDGQANGTEEQKATFKALTDHQSVVDGYLDQDKEESAARAEAMRNEGRLGADPLAQMGYSMNDPIGHMGAPQPGYTWVRGSRGEPIQVPSDIADQMGQDRTALENSKKNQDALAAHEKRLISLSEQMKAVNERILKETANDKMRNDLIAQAKNLTADYQNTTKAMQTIMRGEAAADKLDHKFEIDNSKDWREHYQKWSESEEKYRRKVSDDVREWMQKERSKNNDAERRLDTLRERAEIQSFSRRDQADIRNNDRDMQFVRQQAGRDMEAQRKYFSNPVFSALGEFIAAPFKALARNINPQGYQSRRGGNTNFKPMGQISGK